MPNELILPTLAMLFPIVVGRYADSKWEKVASVGFELFAMVWFGLTVKGMC